MCTKWLQVATLAHDFTSSQEVTCCYALCTVASLVVPLLHSATLHGHECESLMHPDERIRPRSQYSMHEGMVTHQRGHARVGARVGGDEPVQQGAEGAVRGVLHEPGHLLAGITGRVSGARRGPLLLDQRRGEGGGDAPELRGAEVLGRRQGDDGVPDEPERLRGRRGGSDLARQPLCVIHLDMDNAEEPTKRSMICKERLFVTTTVRQGITVCNNKQDNEAQFLLMSTLINGRRRC